jgi:ribonuclease E
MREPDEAARRAEPPRDLEARSSAPQAPDQHVEHTEPGMDGASDRPRGGRSRRGGRRRRRGGGGGERRDSSSPAGYESSEPGTTGSGNGYDGPERGEGGAATDAGYGGHQDFGGQAHDPEPGRRSESNHGAEPERGEPVHSEPPMHRSGHEAPEGRPSIGWSSAPPAEPPAATESRHDE